MELIQEADRSKWMVHSNHNIKCFTEADINRMTNSYRTCLGRGAFGEVYEGALEDGSMVAVKRFIHNVKENFAKEFIVHREINHKNVVRLIGFCEEENALMLVTEYIANGNLSDALHRDNCLIPLDVRLRIAIECAEALAYMHSQMYTQVIHGDIKPGNILLDSNFHAKLSDFGISRLANTDRTLHTKNVIGSIGYMDPLFALDGRLTVKYDVYSFGVVLLELIARKKATTVVDNVNIVFAFTNALARGVRGVRDIFDAEIASKNNMKILESVAKLAGECLKMERNKRPEMIDVAERLRALRKSSLQDQGQERVGLFSWVRKSKPAPPAGVTVPEMILSSGLCRQFLLAEMMAATNNFDESLLFDPSGRVYLGKIDRAATKVAVKHVYHMGGFHSFIEMMSKLSKLRCRHLVPLIGYCHSNDKMLLVYEYMAHGNLCEHLNALCWKQRMEACIGVARGLCYLHELQIIHGNVKMENILLDEEWVAKITDLAPIMNDTSFYSTEMCLWRGYIDPERIIDLERFCADPLTEKSDVYCFGVVLLEVLSARPAMYYSLVQEEEEDEDEEGEEMEGKEVSPRSPSVLLLPLVTRALRCKEKGNREQIVDPHLEGRINEQCLNKFVETAAKCVAALGINRPSIRDVLADLECALELQLSAEMGGS